ncbi:MAG: alpha/beta hydrolase-fold protein [Candidatus Eisenbacteria bacterium]
MIRFARAALLLLLFLGATYVRAQETDPERRQALIQVFQDAMQGGHWATAIAAGEQLQPIGVGNETLAYNLACAYARSAQTAPAITWLARAAESGFQATKLVAGDPDLATLREAASRNAAPGYVEAVARIFKNRAAGLREYQAMAANRPPLVFLPERYDSTRAAPLIIALHGFGADAMDIASAWREVASQAGAILAAPDAVRPTANGRGFQWLYADEGEWRVLDTLDQMKARYRIDPTRVILTGFSQGGNLTLTTGLAYPDLFTGLIPMSGFYTPEEMPLDTRTVVRPRIYLMIGGNDRGTATFEAARRDLERAEYPVRLLTYPGVGHAFPPNAQEELTRALDFVLAR